MKCFPYALYLYSKQTKKSLCFVSDELTRLWNLNQDNMEACKSDSRSVYFISAICIHHKIDFYSQYACFSESSCHRWTSSSLKPLSRLTQSTWWRRSISKLSSKIVEMIFRSLIPVVLPESFTFLHPFRVVRNSNYGWRALRLLSRRSPHFFQPTNQKFKSLADYLDSMVNKLAKELPVRDLVLS